MPDRVVRTGRNLVHKGNIVDFYTDDIKLPDGRCETYDFICHKGAAAILPVLPDGRLLMVKQYRNAVDQFTIELPAGGRNTADEPTIDCAYRELEEETGYYSAKEDIKLLLSLYTTVAFCNEKIDIYYTTGKLTRTEQHLDDDEYIDVAAYTLEELVKLVYEGKIVDAKTIAAIMTYKSMVTDAVVR